MKLKPHINRGSVVDCFYMTAVSIDSIWLAYMIVDIVIDELEGAYHLQLCYNWPTYYLTVLPVLCNKGQTDINEMHSVKVWYQIN